MIDVEDKLKLIGQSLDDLLVKEVVNEGGYFLVYRAEDPQGKYQVNGHKNSREVAIKILKPEHADSSFLTAQTAHEAKVLSGLDHPGIIRCFGHKNFYVGNATYLPGLILEYFKGKDLDSHLKNGLSSKISVPQKTQLLLNVAYALSYSHSHNIMHLEIQPSNILLGGDEIKLIDFTFVKNISKPQSNHKSGNGKSATQLFYGCREFVAPEIFSGHENPASDVYALGLVFYCLLTGQSSPPASVNPPELVIDLPQPVRGLVFSMIQPIYHHRPAMSDVVKELESKLKFTAYN